MRKSKIHDKRRVDRLLQALRAGNYITVACQFAGIDESAYYRWMERGESEASGTHHDFRERVLEARSSAEVESLVQIRQAANSGTWQAAAWYLERSFPHRWGRFNRTELSGHVAVDITELDNKITTLLATEPGVDEEE